MSDDEEKPAYISYDDLINTIRGEVDEEKLQSVRDKLTEAADAEGNDLLANDCLNLTKYNEKHKKNKEKK